MNYLLVAFTPPVGGGIKAYQKITHLSGYLLTREKDAYQENQEILT